MVYAIGLAGNRGTWRRVWRIGSASFTRRRWWTLSQPPGRRAAQARRGHRRRLFRAVQSERPLGDVRQGGRRAASSVRARVHAAVARWQDARTRSACDGRRRIDGPRPEELSRPQRTLAGVDPVRHRADTRVRPYKYRDSHFLIVSAVSRRSRSPHRAARSSRTGPRSRPRRCGTFRRCCGSTRAIRRATSIWSVDYLKQVFDKEGIPSQIFASIRSVRTSSRG